MIKKRTDPPRYQIKELIKKKNSCALIIPVLNEGERLHQQLKKIAQGSYEVDVILSDANSTDGSTDPDLLKSSGVNALINLTSQGGFSASLQSALEYALAANYQKFIMMDGNDKDDVSYLPHFYQKLEEGYDFVQGSRFLEQNYVTNTPSRRAALIKFIHAPLFSWGAKFKYTDTTNGFRAFSRHLLCSERIHFSKKNFQRYELPYYLAWSSSYHNFKVIEIPVKRDYPKQGPLPTKIVGLKRRWDILKPLLMALFRCY